MSSHSRGSMPNLSHCECDQSWVNSISQTRVKIILYPTILSYLT